MGRRRRTELAAGALLAALAVAVMTVTPSSLFRPTPPTGLQLTTGNGFSVSSEVYALPACAGTPQPLYPGVSRCLVMTVTNHLTVPITVQTLEASPTSSSPTDCPASDFSLPSLQGNLVVGANSAAATRGPISLVETGTNEDACTGVVLSFVFNGSAHYTDSTSITLSAAPSASAPGQPITLNATVSGSNATDDHATPGGSVTFVSCPTAACSSTTPLGTGPIGADGVAVFTSFGLAHGVHFLRAIYGGQGTEFIGSLSPVVTLATGATTRPAGGAAPSGRPASVPATSSIAFSGADIAVMVTVALVAIAAGAFLVVTVRRRKRAMPES